MKDLTPTVLITGATSGIGEALAHEYSEKGFRVLFCGRRADRIESLEKELNLIRPQSAKGFVADVVNVADLEAIRTWAEGREIQVDTVIANAGMGIFGGFEKLSLDDYRRQFETNVIGLMGTVKVFLPHLKATKGRVGLVGSVNSYISLPQTSAYCMSKFAVRAFADSLRAEMHPFQVSVTLICPGFIQTEIRNKDNSEKLNPDFKDPVPEWIQMSSKRAARVIQKSIHRRQAEAWVTFHAKFFIQLERFFPCFARFVKTKIGSYH